MSRGSAAQGLVGGAFWTAVGRYSGRAVRIVVIAILSRILLPADFGIVAMVLAITAFGDLMARGGIHSAIIQRKEMSDGELSSVYWFSVAVASAVGTLIFVAAPLIGRLYGEAAVVGVSQLMAAKFPVLGFLTVPYGLLQRRLRFRAIAGVEVVSAVVSGGMGVWLALNGAGYWALVAQLIADTLFRSIGFNVLANWQPKLVCRLTPVLETIRYSGYIAAFDALNHWARKADDFVVGKYLGAGQLGYYEHAYTLMMVPLQVLTYVTEPVLHPVWSEMREDKERLRRGYERVVKVSALVSVPLAATMGFLARPLVLTVWGPGWEPTIDVFRILAVLAAVQPVVSTTGSVFKVVDRTDLLTKVGAVNTAALIVGFVVGLRGGIVGVALGFCASYAVVVTPLSLYVAYIHLLDGRPANLLRTVSRPAVVGAGVAAGAYAITVLTGDTLAAPVQIGVTMTGALLCFLALSRLFVWGEVVTIGRMLVRSIRS